MWETWKDTSSKGREQNPAHSGAEEPCVSLAHILAYSTLRDGKELLCALVNNNSDHDIYIVEHGPQHSGITHACQPSYQNLYAYYNILI